MREILFKAKRLDNGEWGFGYYCHIGPTGYEKHCLIPVYASTFYGIEVDPTTVCEYTGLEDKNGVKIFEGDIVKYPVEQGKYKDENIHTVVFERRGGSGYFGITMSDIETWEFCMQVPAKLMEVIGSIHDREA